MTQELSSWTEGGGQPPGARRRMLELALPLVAAMWNPSAAGEAQHIPIDLDDTADGPCADEKFSLWSVPGKPAIWVCPAWIHCSIEGEQTLYGPAGCRLQLAHELGHILGARKHAEELGRQVHFGGPILCGWASDCIDPSLHDFTAEDVALICGDGGHGGRCST